MAGCQGSRFHCAHTRILSSFSFLRSFTSQSTDATVNGQQLDPKGPGHDKIRSPQCVAPRDESDHLCTAKRRALAIAPKKKWPGPRISHRNIPRAPTRNEPSEAKQETLKELLDTDIYRWRGVIYSSDLPFFFFLPPPEAPWGMDEVGCFWRWTMSRVQDSSLSHSKPAR